MVLVFGEGIVSDVEFTNAIVCCQLIDFGYNEIQRLFFDNFLVSDLRRVKGIGVCTFLCGRNCC